ncbi:unnamed protein product [Lactuca saligna]|uniref:Uncharacterized protein n=1 Tax=Lactuca saligna TaxID=75948 RepID=A0AA36DXS8_LACSI|nr:unnamed protein product [Lactuca saligna]
MIQLSVKTSQTSADVAEQVDYEDINEQYEGPEVQALTEEEYLLPKSDYVSTIVPPVASSSLFNDEDEEGEELQKELDRVDNVDQVDQVQSPSVVNL